MSDIIIKIVIIGPTAENRETVMIKHWIDPAIPSFEKLKKKMFARYPSLKTINRVRIFWIGKSFFFIIKFRIYQ